MRPSINQYFIDMARLVASRSTCIRRRVGCVLVNSRNHVIATGYNGGPAGATHCNQPEINGCRVSFPSACTGADAASGAQLDSCLAIHAEQNAILQCNDVYSITRAYVTTSPCPSCAKLLLNTSCEEIVYAKLYGNTDGLDIWRNAGRHATYFDEAPCMLQRDLSKMFNDELNDWRIIIACICLERGDEYTSKGVVMRILNRWSAPYMLARSGLDLERILRPLGDDHDNWQAVRQLATKIRHVSAQYGSAPLESIPDVTPYALESVKVFVKGDFTAPVVDRQIAAWLAYHSRK